MVKKEKFNKLRKVINFTTSCFDHNVIQIIKTNWRFWGGIQVRKHFMKEEIKMQLETIFKIMKMITQFPAIITSHDLLLGY